MKKQAFLSIGTLAIACSIGMNEFHELENSDAPIPGIFYSMLESKVFSLSHEEREKLYPLTEEVVKDEKITFKERQQILHKIEEIREQSQKSKDILAKIFLDNLMKNKIIAQNKKHLKELILREMKEYGPMCDLNHIDVSNLKDLSKLFEFNRFDHYHLHTFKGDISQWNTSNVENMSQMFYLSDFNGDISKWNTSKVKNMAGMFLDSIFNNDISDWDVSSVEDSGYLFCHSQFLRNIENWKLQSVVNSKSMFQECKAPIPWWYDENAEEIRFKLKEKEVEELKEQLSINFNINKKVKI